MAMKGIETIAERILADARAKANANSAVLVNVGTADFGSDHPLAGMYYQRELEGRAFRLGQGHYHAPVSLLQDYMNQGDLKIKKFH